VYSEHDSAPEKPSKRRSMETERNLSEEEGKGGHKIQKYGLEFRI